MNLLLIRHGEIPSNIKKVYAGRSTEELTTRGKCQAGAVAEKLKKLDVSSIYSSPVHRAVQTAQIISKQIGVDYQIENAFREMELGPWEGLSEATVAERYPEAWEIWNNRPAALSIPGRETLERLQKRVLAGIEAIHLINGNSNLVIITHVAVIRVLLLWHGKKSLDLYRTIQVPNAELITIQISICPSR